MRIALAAICLLITTCGLTALPAAAQCPGQQFQCSNCPGETEETTRKQEYEALKTKFYYCARQAVHVMITAPATKTTIELKETLRKVCDLEQDYLANKNAGVQVSLRSYAGRYIDLLSQVAALHDELSNKCQDLPRHIRQADEAWLMMREEYADYYQDDRLDVEERVAQVSDACKPLQLGMDRLTEVEQEVAKSVQAQLKKNPNQRIDLMEEYYKATEVILERHLNTPPPSTCP